MKQLLTCSMFFFLSRQLMQQIKEQGFLAEVEEQDVSSLPVSCAWESGIEYPATCASASINV